MVANKTSISLTENAMDNLIWLENTINEDPLIMSEREVGSRNRLINLLLETFIPLIRKNFDNHRNWQKTIDLLAEVSDDLATPESKLLKKYAKKIDEGNKTSDKSYYILLDLLQHIIRNNPEDWRDLHSILDASSKEHEIDQHLYELISKDIGQRNRMKK